MDHRCQKILSYLKNYDKEYVMGYCSLSEKKAYILIRLPLFTVPVLSAFLFSGFISKSVTLKYRNTL